MSNLTLSSKLLLKPPFTCVFCFRPAFFRGVLPTYGKPVGCLDCLAFTSLMARRVIQRAPCMKIQASPSHDAPLASRRLGTWYPRRGFFPSSSPLFFAAFLLLAAGLLLPHPPAFCFRCRRGWSPTILLKHETVCEMCFSSI